MFLLQAMQLIVNRKLFHDVGFHINHPFLF